MYIERRQHRSINITSTKSPAIVRLIASTDLLDKGRSKTAQADVQAYAEILSQQQIILKYPSTKFPQPALTFP